MANNADGSIVINTKLDSSGFGRGSKEMESAINSLQQQVNNLGRRVDTAFANMQRSMNSSARSAQQYGKVINQTSKTINKRRKNDSFEDRFERIQNSLRDINAASSKVKAGDPKALAEYNEQVRTTREEVESLARDIAQAGQTPVKTQAFKDLEDMIAKADAKLQGLLERKATLERHKQTGSKAYSFLRTDIDQARRELTELQEERKDMLADHTNDPDMSAYIIPGQTEQFLEYQAQLDNFQGALSGIREDLADTFGRTYSFEIQQEQPEAAIGDPQTLISGEVDEYMTDLEVRLDELERLSNEVVSSAGNAAMMTGAESAAAMEDALNAMMDFNVGAEDAQEYIRQAHEALEEFGRTQFKNEAFVELEQEIESASARLRELQEQEAQMDEAGLGGTEAYSSLEDEIARCVMQVILLNNEMNTMRANGTDMFTGAETDAFAGYTQALSEYENRLNGMQGIVDNAVTPSGQALTRWEQMTTLSGILQNAFDSAAQAASRYAETAAMAIQHPIQALDRLGAVALDAGMKLAQMAGHQVLNGLKGISNHAADAAKKVLGLGRSVSATKGPLQGGLWNIIKYGLGVRSVFALVNRIRSAIKEGFSNLAQYSAPVNSAINSVTSSLAMLKNSLATALAPVFTAIAPAVTYLCNLLATAMNYIAQFMAAITGGKTYIKATKQVEGLAKGIGDAGGAASGAAKETERQLAEFDKLNILSDNNKGGGGGGGGGGGAGSGVGGMFEELPIESAIADFIQRIKDAFAAGDYEEVGRIIAEGINSAVQKIQDFISWDRVHEFWEYWIDAFCRIFNSLIRNIDWYAIGHTFAEGLNTLLHILELVLTGIDWKLLGTSFGTALNGLVDYFDWKLFGRVIGERLQAGLDFLYGAVTTFRWKNLGQGIADSINSCISEVDWEEVGETLSAGARGLLQTLVTAIEGVDWFEVGQSVGECIGAIDWEGIIRDAFEGLGGIAGGLAAIIGGILAEALKGSQKYFEQEAEDCGGNMVLGVLRGVGKIVLNLVTGKWLYENVFVPFFEGFKEAFGISSPAKKMEPIGEYIFEGILKGLKNAIKGIGKWLKNNVFKPIKDGLEKLFSGDLKGANILEVSISLIKKGWTTLTGFIGTAVSVGISLFKKAWSSISDFVGNAVSVGVSLFKKAWTTISDFVGTAVTVYTTLKKKAWTTIDKFVGTAVTVYTTLKKKAWTTLEKFVGNAVTVYTTLKKKAWTTIEKFVGTSVTVQTSLKKKAWTTIDKFVGTAVTVLTSLKKKGWSTISGFVGSAVSVGISLFKRNFSSISDFVGDTVRVGVTLFKDGWNTAKDALGLASGGVIRRNGSVMTFASGGMIHGRRASWWDGVQKYASGTARAHGTVFVTGESGPEIVGHVNGRTEVLNKSQIASTIHSAVLSAMADAVNSFAAFIGERLNACANGIISAIYMASDITLPLPVSMKIDSLDAGRYAAMLSDLQALKNAGMSYTAPVMSTGTVLPYSVSAQIASLDGIADSIETSNDELGQTVVNAISSAAMAIITAIRQSGDTRGEGVDLSGITQRTIDDINRRTRMYSASPIR